MGRFMTWLRNLLHIPPGRPARRDNSRGPVEKVPVYTSAETLQPLQSPTNHVKSAVVKLTSQIRRHDDSDYVDIADLEVISPQPLEEPIRIRKSRVAATNDTTRPRTHTIKLHPTVVSHKYENSTQALQGWRRVRVSLNNIVRFQQKYTLPPISLGQPC
jgi:hypothetical protein